MGNFLQSYKTIPSDPSRECLKTGSTKSIQVDSFWTSCEKIAVTGVLSFMAFVVLFLIQYSHEAFEEEVKDRNRYEYVQKWLTCVYICVMTMMFVIHSMITSHLQTAAHRRQDIKNSRSCADWYDTCDCCCVVRSCCVFCCKVFIMISAWCCNITHSPWKCSGCPGNLACGLFFRNFLRKIPGLIGTVCIAIYEDTITTWIGIAHHPPFERAIVITFCIFTVLLGGCIVGARLGRWAEACCESSSSDSRKPSNMLEIVADNN